jgi:hypothetical protein
MKMVKRPADARELQRVPGETIAQTGLVRDKTAQTGVLAMLHLSRRAAAIHECLDAVRLTQDPARLHAAPATELVSAAAACAKTLVRVAERTGHLGEQRASAFHVIDRARRLLERELRRRRPNVNY